METQDREIITLLTNQMSQMISFAEMFNFYLLNRSVLKDWTFIVSTKESENMDLLTKALAVACTLQISLKRLLTLHNLLKIKITLL